jgi:MoaA/NifB/PqqE/SkfB family radical SAM enzyme
MPLDKFDRIAKKLRNEGYDNIALFSWTEPFVNPRLHEYVTIIKQHGLGCVVSTNFSLRRIPALEPALRSGIDHLIVSVSGFDQEVYEINHVGGNITYVKDNLRRAAMLKRSGEVSTWIVLRFIEFDYNHDQEEKLQAFARELGIDFETIPGVGDPRVPLFHDNDYYEGLIKSYRSERPYDEIGKVCNLMFGQTPIDADGKVFLCCAYPYYDALQIGSYLDLPQEEILLRRYSHPMCASCSAPRRDATPDDNQTLLEAINYRMGRARAETDTTSEPHAEAEEVSGDPVGVLSKMVVEEAQSMAPAGSVGSFRRVWRALLPMPVRRRNATAPRAPSSQS